MDLADLLKKNPQDYDFSLGHVLDFTPEALGMFRGPLLGASLSLLIGTVLELVDAAPQTDLFWGMPRWR